MADPNTIKLELVPWAVGRIVQAYPRKSDLILPDMPPPQIPAVASVVVAADQSLTFTLEAGVYWAIAPITEGGRDYRYLAFELDAPVAVGGGVSYYETNADLPASAVGHPVVLVGADDEAGGQAALRYWTGTGWLIIGLAGGGTIAADYIDVPADIAGISEGKTVLWAGAQFIPGGLS